MNALNQKYDTKVSIAHYLTENYLQEDFLDGGSIKRP